MPRNIYISHGTRDEKRLQENILVEALRIYGVDTYYIPRKIVTRDRILNEIIDSKFVDAFSVEMYVESVDGFEGEGTFLSKFGLEVKNQLKVAIARKRWNELVGRFQVGHAVRPAEGDLIFIPMVNEVFEIKFVDGESSPFYQLSNLPMYRFTLETYDYTNDKIDTGIDAVDLIEREEGFKYVVNITPPTTSDLGYQIGDSLSQTLSDGTIVTGEVADIRKQSSELATHFNDSLWSYVSGLASDLPSPANGFDYHDLVVLDDWNDPIHNTYPFKSSVHVMKEVNDSNTPYIPGPSAPYETSPTVEFSEPPTYTVDLSDAGVLDLSADTILLSSTFYDSLETGDPIKYFNDAVDAGDNVNYAPEFAPGGNFLYRLYPHQIGTEFLTSYFVIKVGSNKIQLTTSYDDAVDSSPSNTLDFISLGTGSNHTFRGFRARGSVNSSGGGIVSITATDSTSSGLIDQYGGTGYASAPSVTITDGTEQGVGTSGDYDTSATGSGSGFVGSVSISNGKIVVDSNNLYDLTISNAGTNYRGGGQAYDDVAGNTIPSPYWWGAGWELDGNLPSPTRAYYDPQEQIDMSGRSIASDVFSGGASYYYQRHATLIGDRVAISVGHAALSVGDRIRFVNNVDFIGSNSSDTREFEYTIEAVHTTGMSNDRAVYILNESAHSSLKRYKFIDTSSSDWDSVFGTDFSVEGFWLNQFGLANVGPLTETGGRFEPAEDDSQRDSRFVPFSIKSGSVSPAPSTTNTDWSLDDGVWRPAISGDSGCPAFILSSAEPILIGTVVTTSVDYSLGLSKITSADLDIAINAMVASDSQISADYDSNPDQFRYTEVSPNEIITNVEVDIVGTNSDDSQAIWSVSGTTNGKLTSDSSSTGYKISSIDSSLESIQDNDETAENNTFEIEGNAFLDFTATNPFGEANFIDE